MSLHPCVNHVTLDNEARPYGAPSIRFVGRGAHTLPNQAAGTAGLAGIAGQHGRIYNPPLRPRLRSSRRGGLHGRPDQLPISAGVRGISPYGVRSVMVHPTRRCAGGYKIRPYRPAPGLLVGADAHIGPPASVCKAVRRTAPSPIPAVGAAFMAARNRAMIRTGVRWFPSP